jgi:effector-binding domain-containing protein
MKITFAVLVLLIIAAFIPFRQHASMSIRASYFEVCQQLALADNWKRWQPDIRNELAGAKQNKLTSDGRVFLISIPGQSFKVESMSANIFEVTKTQKHMACYYNYTVMPDVANNSTIIDVDVRNSIGKWLLSRVYSTSDILDDLTSLKRFMGNAKLYYGFNINEKDVDETYLAIKKETIPVRAKYMEMAHAAKEVRDFVTQNNIQAQQSLAGAYYLRGTDSLQMLIGVPVNKQLNSTGNITFMHMPGGKWLIGDYKGKYGDRQQLYNAMEKYMQDHALLKQIAPFERYLDNKPPAGDDDIINMQINYPVL